MSALVGSVLFAVALVQAAAAPRVAPALYTCAHSRVPARGAGLAGVRPQPQVYRLDVGEQAFGTGAAGVP